MSTRVTFAIFLILFIHHHHHHNWTVSNNAVLYFTSEFIHTQIISDQITWLRLFLFFFYQMSYRRECSSLNFRYLFLPQIWNSLLVCASQLEHSTRSVLSIIVLWIYSCRAIQGTVSILHQAHISKIIIFLSFLFDVHVSTVYKKTKQTSLEIVLLYFMLCPE